MDNSVQNVVTDWKNYTPDPQPVEKGTVIRAVFVNERDIASEILTQTYFIGLQPPERGYTLSLVFEYDDLFGEDGIYVTGKEYDEWYLSGDSSAEAPVPNFEKKREVRATAELLGESGDILNQAVGTVTGQHRPSGTKQTSHDCSQGGIQRQQYLSGSPL